jgi:hypothetical protein
MGELMPVWLASACRAAESGACAWGVAAAAEDDEGKCKGEDARPLPFEAGCSAGGEDAMRASVQGRESLEREKRDGRMSRVGARLSESTG